MFTLENVSDWTPSQLEHAERKLNDLLQKHERIHYVHLVSRTEQELAKGEPSTMRVGISGNDILVSSNFSNRYQMVNDLVTKARKRLRREFERRTSIRRRLRAS